ALNACLQNSFLHPQASSRGFVRGLCWANEQEAASPLASIRERIALEDHVTLHDCGRRSSDAVPQKSIPAFNVRCGTGPLCALESALSPDVFLHIERIDAVLTSLRAHCHPDCQYYSAASRLSSPATPIRSCSAIGSRSNPFGQVRAPSSTKTR